MLYPRPQQAEYTGQTLRLPGLTHDVSLVDFYHRLQSGRVPVSLRRDAGLAREEHIISITADGITVTYATDEGLFRAAASIWQIGRRQGDVYPTGVIHDWPTLPNRGYMLDISRRRMPTMSTIKTIIDFLAALKYNQFQLYMEGECFKYSAYPSFTADFDCLTPSNIHELDAYCRERFIDLVPNQNSFGHMTSWLKHSEFRPLGLYEGDMTPSTLNPLLPETERFMENIYASVLPHFSSSQVNIGLDEAYGLGKYQIEDYCRAHGSDTVFMNWLNKLNGMTAKYGKRVMFWSDMIYKHQRLYHQIPKDAVVLEWGYELIQSQMMTEHCRAFQDAGLHYYVCPSCNTHTSFTGRFDVTSFNVRTAGELAAKYGAEGLLMTDWGNGGHPHFGVWSMVPTALAGQYAWNSGAEQNGETFKADFIRDAERFVDDMVFHCAGVSRLMYRLANYYLLEPERVHVGTMCALLFPYPITQTRYFHLLELKDSGDPFYFDNLTAYVERVMADVSALPFDEQLKREILVNARMVTLASELNKMRLGVLPDKARTQELIGWADHIAGEYDALWRMRNYVRGVEAFLGQLNLHREELVGLSGN